MRRTVAFLLSGAALVAAHAGTPEEIQKHLELQRSAYHCAPAIAAYTRERKRSWAQKVLGGQSLTDQELFIEGAFEDAGISAEQAGPMGKILACNEVTDTYIKNHTCVLSPVVTEGPYYHMEGHPIRQNMAENELGLLFLMDIGVIDVETCKPIPNILVDLWHANATGYYAGHPTRKPGLEDEKPQVGGQRNGLLSAYPRTNHHESWLRAAWPTDKNGVAQFTSIFPGYYTGRATHVHVKIFSEWDQLENNTFRAGPNNYVGQLFVDDDINLQVDNIWPYYLNPIKDTIGRTRNWRDSLDVFPDMHRYGFGPSFDLHKLGGVLEQGFIGYSTLVINQTARYANTWNPVGYPTRLV